jgi:hypothetical protein
MNDGAPVTTNEAWNHPVHGLRLGPLTMAWQLRDLSEVATRKLLITHTDDDGRLVGLRFGPKHYLALLLPTRGGR